MLKHIKLFEEFDPSYDIDMIKMMLMSGDEASIEIVYSTNDENDVDNLVEELYEISFYKKHLQLNGSIKDNNVIRLQGDCVEFIKGLLVEKYNYSDDEIRIKGV